MEKKDEFKIAYKTLRGTYKEFNAVAIWFEKWKITKESLKEPNGTFGDYIVIWDDKESGIINKFAI